MRAPRWLSARFALACAAVTLCQSLSTAASFGAAAASDPIVIPPPPAMARQQAARPVLRGERCLVTFKAEDLSPLSPDQAAEAAEMLADGLLRNRRFGDDSAAVDCRCLQAIAAAVVTAKPESTVRVRQSFSGRAPDCTHQLITTLERTLGGEPPRRERALHAANPSPRRPAKALCQAPMDCLFLEPRSADVADGPQFWWE